MKDEPHAGSEAASSNSSDSLRKKPRQKLWRRFVRYQLRKSHQRKAEREKDRAEEKPEERAARKTAAATVWIAIFTVVLALVGIFTLVEVIVGGSDTYELAVQAKRQADKMEDVSDAAERIRQAADNMVVQAQRIADNAKGSLDASNKQSKRILDTTIANARLDQRAWVGIGQFVVAQFEKRKTLKVDMEIRNSGKTPALHVLEGKKFGQIATIVGPGPLESWFSDIKMDPAEAIPPQGSHITHLEVPLDIISPMYDDIVAKTRTLYIFGKIEYRDIANGTGETDCCIFLVDPVSKTLAFCNAHNDMK